MIGGGWGAFFMRAVWARGTSCRTALATTSPPAGMIFESGARAVGGAAVLPAGTGQTELQVRAAVDIGTTHMPARRIT